ncbi:MAG: flagellar basal body rod protein FlgC [Deltaproteobacteria bacterium]|nr:flagellar basal body rod protein FlgC [Deltaproteobacteria bacterium]MBV8451487.1 flagellar basal body rod protein FlgC [Deltaproteobacteria bacterium]
MSIEGIFAIANSALSAQSERITLIAQNLANVNSTEAPEGGPYQRQSPVFEVAPVDGGAGEVAAGVKLAAVVRDHPKAVYDPSNPLADSSGMVNQPSVNPIYEMVDLMEASRSYQANLALVESARTAATDTINLLK